jgi:hypothetical protein
LGNWKSYKVKLQATRGSWFAGHGASRYVWERPSGDLRPVPQKGAAVQGRWERLTAACLLAAIGAAGLTYFIDLAFDTDLLSVLGQAALAAFACAAIVAV